MLLFLNFLWNFQKILLDEVKNFSAPRDVNDASKQESETGDKLWWKIIFIASPQLFRLLFSLYTNSLNTELFVLLILKMLFSVSW